MGAAQKQESWRGRTIDSQKDVYEGLAYLKLAKPSDQVMQAISVHPCKGRFKSTLADCLQIDGTEPSTESKRYLFGLIQCTSSTIMQAVGSLLGYKDVPIEAFVTIGHENGPAFYAAVKSATSPNDPGHDTAKAYVEDTLRSAVERTGGKIERVTAPQKPSPGQVQAPSINSKTDGDAAALPYTAEDETDDFYSTHAYGTKAALCFNACKTPKNHYAVIVDAALSDGARSYDWKKAIKFQLNQKELPILYGVLVGWTQSAKFDAHGSSNDKSFQIERQEGKVFARVSAKNEAQRAVPIVPADIYPIMNVVLSQIIKEAPEELRRYPDIILHQMRASQQVRPLLEAGKE